MSARNQALFASLSGGRVRLSDQVSFHAVATPATATAGYRLVNTGAAQKRISGSYVAIANEWLLLGSGSDYESRATLNSGDTPTGTLATWQALSTTRTWELSTSSGSLACNLTIEIRDVATSTVLASADIDLSVESS